MVACLLAWVLTPILTAPHAEVWTPAKTHALIVGVLAWPDNALAPFPKRHRKDQELADRLIARGVPAGNVTVLLDDKATTAAATAALKMSADRVKPGETLIVYYCGHGGKSPDGGVSLATVDAATTEGWRADAIGAVLAKHLRGGRVLLLADCCHSGGLAIAAKRLAGARIPAAALTSADLGNVSTNNWTFTQTVLDVLAGSAFADANRDGTLTLSELVAEVEAAMKHRDHQRSGWANFGWPTDLRLAPVREPVRWTKAGPLAPGNYVTTTDKAHRRPARVLAVEGDAVRVQFLDYSDYRVETRPAKEVAPYPYRRFGVGEAANVLWGGRTFPARVLERDGDFHLITYTGYDHSWDEWVLSDRMSPTGPVQRARVEYRGQWFPAQVLKRDGERWFVRYDGFDASWDEWVGKDRIELPEK